MYSRRHFTLVEHQSLYSVKGNKPIYNDGHLGLPEKTFSELEQFILQNPNDAALFLEPSYLKPFGKTLKARQFVGVIETRSGIVIEILPKIAKNISHEETRQIFIKMLRHLRNSPFKNFGMAHLKTEKLHLLEIFIFMFCEELTALIQKGIRSNYITKEENATFLKGKLKLAEHIRRNLADKSHFFIQHDEYLQNRIENRIIRTAIEFLYRKSSDTANKKRLLEFLFVFNDIEAVSDPEYAFKLVKIDRQIKDYQLILQWCSFFLNNESFTTFRGSNIAFALLFDMNRVFENYVAHCLKRDFPGLDIEAQVKKEHLIEYPERKFLLMPDLKIGASIIADTKWKMLDSSKPHYGISQSDIYQMYAYGKKYPDTREIHLIYPQVETFPNLQNRELHFEKDKLKLTIFPFSCKEGRIEGYGRVLERVFNVSCSGTSNKKRTNTQEYIEGLNMTEEGSKEQEEFFLS